MRRHDREITDLSEIISIMQRCDVCRLGLNDSEGYPYILPLNFGMTVEGESVTLYFHGASEGKKLNLIAADHRASFEMDCAHNLILDDDHHSCTMEYESVMGRGIIESVPEADKLSALRILMGHYHHEDFPFGTAVLPRTTVFKLTVRQLTAKRRMKRH